MTTATVWLVDDDEDDQLFIRSAFETNVPPIPLRVLNDGEELLPTLAKCQKLPHLILLDINMPRQDGFQTLYELRATADFAHLPVVMLTTSSAEEDRNRSLALGADGFLTKPLTFDQLKNLAGELSQQWALA